MPGRCADAGDRCRLARADDVLEHGFAGDAVAEFLGTVEPGASTGTTGTPQRALPPCTRLEVVADHRRNAGGVHEDGLRRVSSMACLMAWNRRFSLRPITMSCSDRSVVMPMRNRAGPGRARAAVVPRIAGAGDRPVHDVRDVGNRKQRDLRAVERATAGGGARLRARAAALGLVRVVRAQAGSFSSWAISAVFMVSFLCTRS
jgi:hypothetical protein